VSRSYVTDITHLLDEHGRPVHGAAGSLARYLGLVVEAASVMIEGTGSYIPMRCANPARRKRCGEQLAAGIPSIGTIEWECPSCGECGLITGWSGTVYDLRAAPKAESRGERCDVVVPLDELDAARRYCDVPPVLRRLLVEATGVGEDYLFFFAGHEHLLQLRDSARVAADSARGADRRLLDRLAARVDAFMTTLPEFVEGDERPRELLN
jgi:hypothetical protein